MTPGKQAGGVKTFLTEGQRETLNALCRRMLPHLDGAAHDLAERSGPRLHQSADRPASSQPRPIPSLPPHRLSEFARVLADGDPQTWTTLRARHTPGRDGRCTVCRSSRQPAERWPCTLRAIADQAADLASCSDIGDSSRRGSARKRSRGA